MVLRARGLRENPSGACLTKLIRGAVASICPIASCFKVRLFVSAVNTQEGSLYDRDLNGRDLILRRQFVHYIVGDTPKQVTSVFKGKERQVPFHYNLIQVQILHLSTQVRYPATLQIAAIAAHGCKKLTAQFCSQRPRAEFGPCTISDRLARTAENKQSR